MNWTRSTIVLLALLLTIGLLGGRAIQATADADPPILTTTTGEATVTVTLADLGLEFGAIENWQASLYAGAVVGEETGGRFTAWVTAVDGAVTFNLPADISGGDAPWGIPHDAYVRVRSGSEEYPTFDMVSDPFTLEESDYVAHFDINGLNEYAVPVANFLGAETAEITVMLADFGGLFGKPGEWEASLYAGAEPGQETGGRFTAWVPAVDGAVVFNLPDDVSAGNEAPWGDEAYIRVRQVGDTAYPKFDLVGRPFELTDGAVVTSHLHLNRAATEKAATVAVSLTDLGLEFGAIENWQASLYAGAVAGEETGGRFTAWFDVTDGAVHFTLPDDVSLGAAPWAVPHDTYVRVRSGGGEYPTFDMVSDPFTLLDSHYVASFAVDGANEYDAPAANILGAETAEVTVMLADFGGLFGKPGDWEASLYAGPEPGEETNDRFTAWVEAVDGAVVFNLPDDVLGGQTAPWGDEAYIRVRQVGAVYPTFDLVGRPFDLTDGVNVTSVLHIQRGVLQADATVTVTLADMGLDFGAINDWEVSLYAGAEVGSETGGRFTAWKTVADGQVVFLLPGEISPGNEAPWCEANNAYVRLRSGGGEYPTFDMVSDPFTLCESDYVVHFDFEGVNEYALPAANNIATNMAEITVMLEDWGGLFGKPGAWEASLYAGAEPGQETGGRFTAWVAAVDGAVVFNLPDDVSAGNEAPWGEDAYIRVRQVDATAYPKFDLVGRPFELTDGAVVTSKLVLSRLAVETAATITVNLFDMGLEFGAIENWQASLYAGAVAGQETGGRFTAWFNVTDGAVNFSLPADATGAAPWAVPHDAYVRVRSGSGEYPTFDLVSNPFTLADDHYLMHIRLDSVNEYMEEEMGTMAAHETAQVTVHLHDFGGDFGKPGLWEASLYAGAVAGEETGGRFTAWVQVVDGAVVFNLPDDVSAGNEAPWDEDAYVRVRQVGESYPTFDLVGRPFLLTDGANIHSTITWQRSLVTLIYLPVVMR